MSASHPSHRRRDLIVVNLDCRLRCEKLGRFPSHRRRLAQRDPRLQLARGDRPVLPRLAERDADMEVVRRGLSILRGLAGPEPDTECLPLPVRPAISACRARAPRRETFASVGGGGGSGNVRHRPGEARESGRGRDGNARHDLHRDLALGPDRVSGIRINVLIGRGLVRLTWAPATTSSRRWRGCGASRCRAGSPARSASRQGWPR